jgi:copper chaperone CopZ
VEEASLVVEGMKCSLCVRGIRQSLTGLPGVGGVEADLATGRVRITAMGGRSLALAEIRARIARWGFRVVPEPLVIRASGAVNHGPKDRLTFRVQGTNEVFDLLEGDELRRLLMALPAAGNPKVVLTARLHEHPGHLPPSLSILSYEVKKP